MPENKIHPDFGAEMAVDASSASPRSAAIAGRSEPELKGDDLLADRLDGPGVNIRMGSPRSTAVRPRDVIVEPPALRVAPDEEASGLWLWHGAPPDQQQRQKVPRRGVRRLSIGAAVVVPALSALAGLVLIVPRLTEPAGPSASSPATVAIARPPPVVETPTSSPPAIDTPATPRATIDPAASPAAVAGTPTSAPASAGPPAGVPAEPPARERAEPAPSRASAPAPRRVSSRGSRPVAAKPGVVWHHDSKQTGTSLTDLLATPAFRDGTLRPVQDH